jgi:deoxyribonuclease V
VTWPRSGDALVARQHQLARATPPPWLPASDYDVGGCFVCFPRGPTGAGAAGDPAWAAAAVMRGEQVTCVVARGAAGASFEPGLLALREGPLLELAIRALPAPPAVLLVNASGRDHPRRAGLALQLGAELDMPTVSVTHRPLLARGGWPDERRGAIRALTIEGETVATWLRTRASARPLVVHPGWRTDLATAVAVVVAATGAARTPEPLRAARRAARTARAATGADTPPAG